MASVWEEMARNSTKAGRRAYAKHKSALFKEMEQHAKKLFNDIGYGHLIKNLLDNDGEKILADYVILERSDPQYIIPELSVKVKIIFLLCWIVILMVLILRLFNSSYCMNCSLD